MAEVHAAGAPRIDVPWRVVERWQAYQAEALANRIRVAAVASLYLVELGNYHGFRLGAFEVPPVSGRAFHLATTALAVAATAVAIGVQVCLHARLFPAALKYLSTAADLLVLTTVLAVGDGPRSPLIAGYFVILAMATLRFSLPLARFAGVGVVAAYLVLLGRSAWFDSGDRVPRYHQIIVLIALVLTGLTLGQVVRGIRALARDYAARVGAERPGEASGP